jgi:hypothetical protein
MPDNDNPVRITACTVDEQGQGRPEGVVDELETVTLTVIGGPIRGVLEAVASAGAGGELAERLTQALKAIYPSIETHAAVQPGSAAASTRPPVDNGPSELERVSAHVDAVAEMHSIGGRDWQRGMHDAARLMRRADSRDETTVLVTTADPLATHYPGDRQDGALLEEAMRAAWRAGVDAAIHKTAHWMNEFVGGVGGRPAFTDLHDRLVATVGQDGELLDPDLIALYQRRATESATSTTEPPGR